MEHDLRIKSLRDTMAECSCGGWQYVSIPSNKETDTEIRRNVEQEFRKHDRGGA